MSVHSTAIIGPHVKLHPSVAVGPFSIITGDVSIGAGTVLHSHVCIGSEFGIVSIGEKNEFYQGAVIGGTPQDLKYKGEPTKLIIGNNNIFREFCTLNLGTVTGLGQTVIGNDNLLMAYVHVAHDCLFGNNIIVANSTQFAGHVEVQDHVTIGGHCSITQFMRFGRFSYIGASSSLNKDITPFTMAEGRWAKLRATNKIGLERNGFDQNEIRNIHKALRILIKGEGTVSALVSRIKEECKASDSIQELLHFIEASQKGLAR